MLKVGNSKRLSSDNTSELSSDYWKKKLTHNQIDIARKKFKLAIDKLKVEVGIDIYNESMLEQLKIQCCKSVLAGEF